MCGPAAAVVGVAGAANYAQGRQQASAQNKFNKKQYEINRIEALRAMVHEITGVQKRISEERTSAGQALLQLNREAAEARGEAATSLVEGRSIDALLKDYTRQELIRIGVAEEQLRINESTLTDSIEAIQSQARTRITQGFGQPASGPSLLNAAIQIGAASASAYYNYDKR